MRNAAARLETLRTPEGVPLPGNTLAELRREMTRLQLIGGQIREIETTRVQQLEPRPSAGAHPMVRLLAQVRGVGVETADMLVNQAFLRPLRDQRAVARGACPGLRPRGCTHLGAPDWLLLTAEASRRAQGYAAVHGILGIREAHYGDYRPGGDGVVGWRVRGSPPR